MNNSQHLEKGSMEKGGVLYPVVGEGSAHEEGEPSPGTEGEVQGEEEEETRVVSAPPVPVTPSREEVERHRLTHRPFRLWCPHCVRGKCRADKHTASKQKGVESGIPKLASDYFYIGQRRPQGRAERDELEEAAAKEGQTPILVIKDSEQGNLRPRLSM